MKPCRECGALSNDDAVFCAVCGMRFLDEHNDIVTAEPQNENGASTSTNNNGAISPLLQRISLFLEDEEYGRADVYCERVLDMEPTNAEAYLAKLLVEFRCSSVERLKGCLQDISASKNYAKILRFGNNQLRKELMSINEEIQKNIQLKIERTEQADALTKQRNEDCRAEECYIDIYCPFCHAELSYTDWQIEEGSLSCPECDTQFEYNERFKRY